MKTLFLRMAISGSLTAAAAFGNRLEKVLDPRARLSHPRSCQHATRVVGLP
jgi:hypothetical protein